MVAIYALYREAKNNISPYYRFLCYYKILEGIYNKLRPEAMKRAKENRKRITKTRDVVPQDDSLESFGRTVYKGRSVKDVFDNVLAPEYRNAAAHFSLSDGTLLNVSAYYDQGKFQNILELAEVCCRTAINSQNDIYNQIGEK